MFTEPPPELLARIPGIYTSKLTSLEDTIIHAHFFLGRCHWYVAEYDGQDTSFGFATLGKPALAEWGYFGLSGLRSTLLATDFRDRVGC